MNDFEIGDKVVVFKRYGEEHYLSDIVDISHSNIKLANGDIVNPKLISSLSIFKYDEQKMEDALFEHRINLVIKSLNNNKELRKKVSNELLSQIENIIEVDFQKPSSECLLKTFKNQIKH